MWGLHLQIYDGWIYLEPWPPNQQLGWKLLEGTGLKSAISFFVCWTGSIFFDDCDLKLMWFRAPIYTYNRRWNSMLCWGKAVYILNQTPTQFDAFDGLYHSFVCSTYIVVTTCCRVWVCLEIQNLKIHWCHRCRCLPDFVEWSVIGIGDISGVWRAVLEGDLLVWIDGRPSAEMSPQEVAAELCGYLRWDWIELIAWG